MPYALRVSLKRPVRQAHVNDRCALCKGRLRGFTFYSVSRELPAARVPGRTSRRRLWLELGKGEHTSAERRGSWFPRAIAREARQPAQDGAAMLPAPFRRANKQQEAFELCILVLTGFSDRGAPESSQPAD